MQGGARGEMQVRGVRALVRVEHNDPVVQLLV